MTEESKVATTWAQAFGRRAYLKGTPRVPVMDPLLCELLEGVAVGNGIPLSLAWLRGWDAESLREEGPTTECCGQPYNPDWGGYCPRCS